MAYQLSASYYVRYNESKPPLPYTPGQEFCVHLHTPPAPATGEVVESVRMRDQHSAQLVIICVIDETSDISGSIPADQNLVIKLYNPLCFDHDQDDVNPFHYTDLAYSLETAVYQLLYSLEETIISRYCEVFYT
ncbi:predicted protein [Histoplasma capsulatum G186AR]|uniref:Uncharacterized protein n=2 Tax=Ajellomyces capsulatus TaxID=5037 RepID=C0NI49_AJECG|nr:uncharacterized protein HCBG_03021 [Histoplasma capsulatum G186AR]EEH09484.1 predicted protein [Histoplasma capsulatum G186AR]